MRDEWYKTKNSVRLHNTLNMPGSDRAIIQSIFKMTDQHKNDNVTYVNAVVLIVDIPNRKCSCTAIDGHTEYELPTVRLMASVDDGVLIEPEIGSTIKVIFSQNIEPFAVQFSGIKNIWILASEKIIFNDGSFGGLVKVKDLTTKLNTLENDLNALKNAFKTWVTVPSDGGAALKLITTTWFNSSLSKTAQSDIENLDITHGTN